MYKLRVYCASGWFTTYQQETYEAIVKLLESYSQFFDVFYPKEASADLQHSLAQAAVRRKIFNRNIKAMRLADLIICSTEDKDMGAVWESGFCYAIEKPTIYCNFHLEGKPFNLMLTESGLAIARDLKTLEQILVLIIKHNSLEPELYSEFRKEIVAE